MIIGNICTPEVSWNNTIRQTFAAARKSWRRGHTVTVRSCLSAWQHYTLFASLHPIMAKYANLTISLKVAHNPATPTEDHSS
jgi:hypothetical protein